MPLLRHAPKVGQCCWKPRHCKDALGNVCPKLGGIGTSRGEPKAIVCQAFVDELKASDPPAKTGLSLSLSVSLELLCLSIKTIKTMKQGNPSTAHCKRRAMQGSKWSIFFLPTCCLSTFFCAACLDCPFASFLNSACVWLKWSFSYKEL